MAARLSLDGGGERRRKISEIALGADGRPCATTMMLVGHQGDIMPRIVGSVALGLCSVRFTGTDGMIWQDPTHGDGARQRFTMPS